MRAQLMPAMESDADYDRQSVPEENRDQIIPGLVLTVLMLTLLGVAGIKLVDPSTLPVRQVSVTGDFIHLSPVSLQKRVSGVVKGGFFNVNVDAIQNVLLQEPWVREVAVNRIWPDKITVNIREQIAVAQWGDSGLLNSDAKIFSPDPDTFPENLPVVYGPVNSADLLRSMLLQIGEILPDEFSVRELVLSDRRSWTLRLDSGLIFRLGKDRTLDRIEQFFRTSPVQELSSYDQIQYVDMRYTNGFVIRWKTETESDLNDRQEGYGEKI